MRGDETAAREAFARVAPVLLMRSQYSHQIGKAYLRHIGVFSTTYVRRAGRHRQSMQIDLDELLRAIERAEGARV